MSEFTDTLIVGGGQAGLSLAYYLKQQGRDHLVLEQAAAPAEAWRNHRWDSFTLVTPNWTTRLPGGEYAGDNSDGYMTRAELVDYFENYVSTHAIPIRYNVRATGITQNGTFQVETTQGSFEAKNVVIATGLFQSPKLPPFARNINPAVTQLHSGEYHNPDALGPGAVLVVGSGQSGCQIAEELHQAGRTVYLSTGTAPRVPRRYRGKDCVYWLYKTGFFDQRVDQLPSPRAKYGANPQATGKDGGHNINLHQFARDGIILLGRIQDAADGKIRFATDLYENLKSSDDAEARIVKMVDAYIEQHGLSQPLETLPVLRDGYDAEIITELDVAARGITQLIWGMGYAFDFSWIGMAQLDADGYPIQTRGVTNVPGLYFLGLNFMYTRKSALLLGIAEDAAYLAEQLAARQS